MKVKNARHVKTSISFPVKDGRFCIDCDTVFFKGDLLCPRCGSHVWMPLSTIIPSINSQEAEVRDTYRPGFTAVPDTKSTFRQYLWRVAALIPHRRPQIQAGV